MKYLQPLYKYRYTLLILLVSIPFILYAFSLKTLTQNISRQKIQQTLMLQKVFSTKTPTPVLSPTIISKNPQDRMLDKIEHRQQLSPSDISALNKMLSTFIPDKETGTIYKNHAIQIEYLKTSNLFQVEILNKDIEQAKSEANTWFRQQGMSQEGVCNYPVQFYLNYDLKQQLPKEQVAGFNPLPPGC
jgi:hypothetical protein